MVKERATVDFIKNNGDKIICTLQPVELVKVGIYHGIYLTKKGFLIDRFKENAFHILELIKLLGVNENANENVTENTNKDILEIVKIVFEKDFRSTINNKCIWQSEIYNIYNTQNLKFEFCNLTIDSLKDSKFYFYYTNVIDDFKIYLLKRFGDDIYKKIRNMEDSFKKIVHADDPKSGDYDYVTTYCNNESKISYGYMCLYLYLIYIDNIENPIKAERENILQDKLKIIGDWIIDNKDCDIIYYYSEIKKEMSKIFNIDSKDLEQLHKNFKMFQKHFKTFEEYLKIEQEMSNLKYKKRELENGIEKKNSELSDLEKKITSSEVMLRKCYSINELQSIFDSLIKERAALNLEIESLERKKIKYEEKGINNITYCTICMDSVPDIVFMDCKHLCVCERCFTASMIYKNNMICPLCRCEVKDTMKVFVN